MSYLDNKKTVLIISGLEYPEGPIYCKDGSILLVEIKGQCLSRILPDGSRQVIACIEGGPNGAAVVPSQDGSTQLLVCNDGGFDWVEIPPPKSPRQPGYKPSLLISGLQPEKDYKGGSLWEVNLDTGDAVPLPLTSTSQTPSWPPPPFIPESWSPPFPLRGPDDLVVDAQGGVWLTDFGKQRARDKDITGVYYLAPDRSSLRQAIYPLNSPNGIGLSPDGKWLYVAISYERRLLKYEIGPAGSFKPNPKTLDGSYLVTADFQGSSVLDSLALDEEGNIYVATMVPQGSDPGISGGISVVSPDGEMLDFVEIKIPGGAPAPLPSNICFGGADMKTAYVTCGGTGHLISMPARIAGLKLNYNC